MAAGGDADALAGTPRKGGSNRPRRAMAATTPETTEAATGTGAPPAASPSPDEPALDPAEEVLLQRLFERYCTHGADRPQTPEKHIARQAFGPEKTGAAVRLLQEDVARFPLRLDRKSERPPFVFSKFAHGHPSTPRMDNVRFAKLCRECDLYDNRVLDEYLQATGLTSAEADIAWRKVLPHGRRALGFDEFCTALLPELARKKATSVEALKRQILGDNPSDRPALSPGPFGDRW
jgi:hypothetical protein